MSQEYWHNYFAGLPTSVLEVVATSVNLLQS